MLIYLGWRSAVGLPPMTMVEVVVVAGFNDNMTLGMAATCGGKIVISL